MAKQLFVITVRFLLFAVSLLYWQSFVYVQGDINVAFVYDCRYSLQLQQDFFTQFIQVFEPLKQMVSNHKAGGVKTDINLILMTYTESKLMMFEKLTQENFTLDKFNVAALKLNTSSCPQHFPLKTVFNDTREALGGYSGNVRKLAILVLAENMTDYKDDDAALRGLESEQRLNGDVKRVFILIKTRTELKEKGLYSLYTNTLNNSLELVKKSIRIIFNSCNNNFEEFKHGTSRYYLTKYLNAKTASEADKICKRKWPGSHMAYINSQSELEYLTSVDGIIESNCHVNCFTPESVFFSSFNPFSNAYTLNKIEIVGFIGMSSRQRNYPEDYIWNDGTPLVVDLPWGSRSEGQGCVYMSITYTLNYGVITREHLQWNEWECNKPKLTDFLVCESDMSDANMFLLNLKELKPKKQDSYIHLLYTSYSHLLLSLINNELQNNMTWLMNKKISYNVIQEAFIITCKISEIILMNDRSTNITPIDLFIQIIQRKRPNCRIKIIDHNSDPFNDDSYKYERVRHNVHNSTLLNESRFDVRYLNSPIQTVQKCLYEIDSNRRRVGFQNNSHLQDCEHVVCPPGFIKCTESYCIPVYIVDDGVKDCPNGEDEISVKKETTLCTGKLKFTLRNICLQQDICNANDQCKNHINEFVCQVPCDTGYVCMSNIVRKETGKDTAFYIRSVETKVQIYEDLGVFSFTPQIYSLFQLFKLKEIDLSNCRIRDLDNVFLSLDISDVIILDISRNSISGPNNFFIIQEMKNLQKLNISYNKYLEFDENFIFPLHLQVLDFCHTQGGSGVMKNLINLIYLKDLSPRDAFSTCEDLIGDPQKRVILWVVGILSLLGNMVVVIYRIVWDRAVFNKAYGLFVVCLGVSDFIMGIYLMIIAGADLLYQNMYVLEDLNWRYSNTCKLAGILSTFSSETSTMFICLITLDRYLVIKYPFGEHRFSKTGKITSLCLTLIIGVVVSVIPVLFPGWEIYSSSGMCLALPFSSGRHTGWEYSAVLFVGLNLCLFILIAIGQLAIFLAITAYKGDDCSTRRDDERKAHEIAVAKKLFLVAFSDFCCWFPIGIMGIMSLNGFQFSLDAYVWSAVLVLPINSAINPIIYTLPAILRKIKSGHEVSKLTLRST